ncbi:MAG: hypothetical protein RR214_00515 [Synergistaceae bacterium]
MSKGCTLKWEGDKVMSKIDRIALETLWLAGQGAITHSINDVPLDTGTLRRSGVVTVDDTPVAAEVYEDAKGGKGKYSDSAKDKETSAPMPANKRRPKVVASYNTPYAIKLHESSNWRPRSYKYTAKGNRREKPAVGRWKWLERAIPTVQKNMPRYLSRAKKKVGL